MKRKKRIAYSLEEWLKDPSLTPGWKITEEERQQKEAKREAWSRVLYALHEPLTRELRKLGFEVETVCDLYNRKQPWRKDAPLPDYREVIPLLVEHFQRPYSFEVKEAILRALIDRHARKLAFEPVLEEFRRTADPQVAQEEIQRALQPVLEGAGDYWTPEEAEPLLRNRWNSYRFTLMHALGYLFSKEHIPIIVELLQDERHSAELRKWLARDFLKKLRRWRIDDPELRAVGERYAQLDS